MESTTLYIKNDDRKYYWSGGLGSVFKSYESEVKLGDVRYIAGELFYVYSIYNKNHNRFYFGGPREVNWCFTQKVDYPYITQFKNKLFTGGNY